MGTEKIISTGLKFDEGRTSSLFQGHPEIRMAGAATIDETPDAWSPSHMLVAAAESCLFLTIAAVAEKMRIRINRYSSTAEGTLYSEDGKHREFSLIVVRPRFELADESDRSKIPQLVKIAEEYCYIARSLKAPVRVELG